MTSTITELLEKIEFNTRLRTYHFNAGIELVKISVIAIGFVVGLSVNNAVRKSFALIQVGGETDTTGGAWLNALVVLTVGLIVMIVILKNKQFIAGLAYKNSLLHAM